MEKSVIKCEIRDEDVQLQDPVCWPAPEREARNRKVAGFSRSLAATNDRYSHIPGRPVNPATIMNSAFDPESPLAALTDRERDILRELARGASLKEAARNMGISYKAADHLKQQVMKKLDLHDRVALCLFALREGLIS